MMVMYYSTQIMHIPLQQLCSGKEERQPEFNFRPVNISKLNVNAAPGSLKCRLSILLAHAACSGLVLINFFF